MKSQKKAVELKDYAIRYEQPRTSTKHSSVIKAARRGIKPAQSKRVSRRNERITSLFKRTFISIRASIPTITWGEVQREPRQRDEANPSKRQSGVQQRTNRAKARAGKVQRVRKVARKTSEQSGKSPKKRG